MVLIEEEIKKNRRNYLDFSVDYTSQHVSAPLQDRAGSMDWSIGLVRNRNFRWVVSLGVCRRSAP